MSEMLTMDDALTLVEKIASGGHDKIVAGETITLSEAATNGDYVAQGDMNIVVVRDKVPKGYKKLDKPIQRLVPGDDNTVGSKHCLDSTDGVEMYIPSTWDETSLDGPFLRLTNGATITHPVHGDVVVPSCHTSIQIEYQREWDAEQARERRARD